MKAGDRRPETGDRQAPGAARRFGYPLLISDLRSPISWERTAW